MELLLNLLWFLVALASFALWWTRWSRAGNGRGQPQKALRDAVGLSCVLVLLFFAISLTDDLQAVPMVAEDARSPWRAFQNYKRSQAEPDPDKQTARFAEAVSPTMFFPASVVVWLSPSDWPSPQPTLARPVGGRAPPSFPL